jgi:hypothetical protein
VGSIWARSGFALALFCILGLASPASAQVEPFTLFDFNLIPTGAAPATLNPNPAIVVGTPTIRLAPSWVSPGAASIVNNTTDDTGDPGDPNTGINRVWRTTGLPTAGTGNKTAGFQVDNLATTSRSNILMTFSVGANTNTGANAGISRWYQAQYSTNGGATFFDYSAPIELRRQAGDPTPWYTNIAVNFAGIAAANNSSDFRVRVVSTFAPGTSDYQALVGTYNPSAPVNFDMIGFSQANRRSSNPVSTSLNDAANWTTGPTTGTIASHLTFGSNTTTGTSVTVNNTLEFYNALSITFATDVNKPYIFTGSRMVFGAWPASNQSYVSNTALLNTSGQSHVFNTPITLQSIQTWDSGSVAGGGFTFNGQIAFESGSGIRITGQNPVTLTGQLVDLSLSGSIAGVSKFGNNTLTLSADSGSTLVNFTVLQGLLRVNNTAGSGTGGGSVTVNGGRLEGVGTIIPATGRLVTINPGGTIRGGFAFADGASNAQAVGTLSVAGSVNIKGAASGAGGALAVDLNSTTNSSSRVAATTGAGDITFDVTNGMVKIRLENDQNLVLNQQYTFTIASSTGGFKRTTTSGTTTVTSYGYNTDFFLDSSWFGTFGNVELFVQSQNLILQFTPLTPVPEPSISILAVAGLVVLGSRYRRRLQKR